jgi:intracellular multiplication protein IcmE
MSNHNHSTNSGYEDEAADPTPPSKSASTRPAPTRNSERLANLRSVFGHGAGKIAIIAAGVFVLTAAALGIRGLRSNSHSEELARTKVDMPTPPTPTVTVDPIEQKEVDRRLGRAALESEEAQRRGKTYQPDFIPAVEQRKQQALVTVVEPEQW